ncbi:MAG: hypothetical protein WD278_05675 [Pirellulales bacterium]
MLAAAGGPARAWAAPAADARAELIEQYAGELEQLARQCEGRGLRDEAQRVRGWILPQDPFKLSIPLLDTASGSPVDVGQPPPASGDADWEQEFARLRRQQAERLWTLALEAADQRRMSLAYSLVHEVLREDPQHGQARRLLGYKLHDGKWLTTFEQGKARSRQVWHDRFGWLPASHVERYEAGERLYKGKWLAAEEEARLRTDIDRGWEVMTEHYLVRTNHSLEEGVRLAARLEALYGAWRQVFVRFYLSDKQLEGLFRSGAPAQTATRRHLVVYFRDRDEYTRALAARQPNIGISTGYYLADDRKAYFFVVEPAEGESGPAAGAPAARDDTNVYHEATHQLFSETKGGVRHPARDANFWVVEAVACYMESLVEGDGFCTLGGAQAVRLGDARFRLLEDDFYLPLAQFSGFGVQALQRDPRIAMLYSQAAGLAHFFMHYDQGRYRDALVDYLLAIYSGRDRQSTLPELTATSFDELDRQYRDFIAATAAAAP